MVVENRQTSAGVSRVADCGLGSATAAAGRRCYMKQRRVQDSAALGLELLGFRAQGLEFEDLR